MIKTVCLDGTSKKFIENFEAAQISDQVSKEKNVVWADVSDPTSEDFLELAKELLFHVRQ